MDLTPLIRGPSMNIATYVEGSIQRFAQEVKERLVGLAGSSAGQVNSELDKSE
jgi:hypothetical protein